MRHRMGGASMTGLGNPKQALLQNSGKLTAIIKKMLQEAIELYFKEWEGCDYDVRNYEIVFGIEPAYQYDKLKVISIHRDKHLSYIKTGKAWGVWGSEIASNTKYYKDYKYNSKFVKFVDRWYTKLYT